MSHYPHARLIDEANSVMIALDMMTFPTYMHTSPFSTVKGCFKQRRWVQTFRSRLYRRTSHSTKRLENVNEEVWLRLLIFTKLGGQESPCPVALSIQEIVRFRK